MMLFRHANRHVRHRQPFPAQSFGAGFEPRRVTLIHHPLDCLARPIKEPRGHLCAPHRVEHPAQVRVRNATRGHHLVHAIGNRRRRQARVCQCRIIVRVRECVNERKACPDEQVSVVQLGRKLVVLVLILVPVVAVLVGGGRTQRAREGKHGALDGLARIAHGSCGVCKVAQDGGPSSHERGRVGGKVARRVPGVVDESQQRVQEGCGDWFGI
ncbi:hypothetical protein BCR44DRAFT_1441663 [Catenaria anguillulae PL171]|uniref:Uncharacterized protein n=1 Tax=Catenaria anguillulae PL171 TaxID=765915 RepID=A0A1Y2HCU4_9FUNG|nr:hypothetical protein BCR44DRAFT_1441663 [Catenaria anguillulae PL171]